VNALPPPPRVPSRPPPVVTWSLLATVVTTGVIVLGGVLAVEAEFDGRFEKLTGQIERGDRDTRQEIRREVSQLYARRSEVARDPVERTEVDALNKQLDRINNKLDRLLAAKRR